jgi:hypothetical protein
MKSTLRLRGFTCITVGCFLVLFIITLTGRAQAQTGSKVYDAASGKDEVGVISKNGKIQTLTSPQVPVKINDPLSNLVEKFLRSMMQSHEEFLSPPKYTELSYIKPGDDLGMIEKNGQARSVRSENVPFSVRQALGASTEAK